MPLLQAAVIYFYCLRKALILLSWNRLSNVTSFSLYVTVLADALFSTVFTFSYYRD